jgi:hypothetical protein
LMYEMSDGRLTVNTFIHGKRETSNLTNLTNSLLSIDTAALHSSHRIVQNYFMYRGDKFEEIQDPVS